MVQVPHTNTPHNAKQRDDIERIVRLVLERLQSFEPALTAERQGTDGLSHSLRNLQAMGVVRLDQRLVTLEDLRDRWQGMKSLEVPMKCIITPAVQDELRDRGIELQRQQRAPQSTPESQSSNTKAGVLETLLVLLPTGSKAATMKPLQLLGATLQVAPEDCGRVVDAIQAHTQTSQKYCLWSSSRPFAAMRACCAATGQVAAIQLSRANDLQAAVEQACPTVLILDDRQWNSDSLVSLARAWMKLITRRSSPQ